MTCSRGVVWTTLASLIEWLCCQHSIEMGHDHIGRDKLTSKRHRAQQVDICSIAIMSPTTNPVAQKKVLTAPEDETPIHPLFRKARFSSDIDWETAFRIPSLLATRLLHTPQALHWVYAFLYGINENAAIPAGVDDGDVNRVPYKYACNKGVRELTFEDVMGVKTHLLNLADNIRIEVVEFDSRAHGKCKPLGRSHLVTETNGYPSVISINHELYKLALSRNSQTAEEAAMLDLNLAVTMLHEVAHALGNASMGARATEDFFETSLIAECGWEFESRIFGMCPAIKTKSKGESHWVLWQTTDGMTKSGYDLDLLCRNAWKLPKRAIKFPFNPKFALSLVSDSFWSGIFARKGALAVLPDCVHYLCESGKENNSTRGIPQSIRDLFRGNAKSYAQKKYARLANPDHILRGPPLNLGNQISGNDTVAPHSAIEVAAKAPSKGRDQPSIHPIFAKSQFADNIKWTKAFRKSSILATRLLDSPQALHFMYAFFYGTNTDTALPEDYFRSEDHAFVPFEFACNKGITQLSTADISAVRQHLLHAAQYIRFEVAFGGDPNITGEAECVERPSPDTPHDSCIIRISEELYDHAMAKDAEDSERAATVEFAVAIVMLHELAHALHIIYMGPRDVEDFFEDSLVAELGFEFESRLFGMCPIVRPENLRNSDWRMWQTQLFLEDNFRLSYYCRDESKLSTTGPSHPFSPGWAADLAENSFWDEYDESVTVRALTLIPDCVVDRVRRRETQGIPKSIQELICPERSKSYAEKQYVHLANPDRVPRPHSLRRIDLIDNHEVDREGSETEESESPEDAQESDYASVMSDGEEDTEAVGSDMYDDSNGNGTQLGGADGLITGNEDVEMTDIEA